LTEKNSREKGDEGERQQLARLRVALKRSRARYASGIWKYGDNQNGEKGILRTMKNRKGNDRFWWPSFRRTLSPRMHERKSAGITGRLAPHVFPSTSFKLIDVYTCAIARTCEA